MNENKIFLCCCEDVTLREWRQAYSEGFTEMESLKRYTGLGTGFCQGKRCLSEAACELAELREIEPASIRLTTIRPPAEPLTFAELAALDLDAPGAVSTADTRGSAPAADPIPAPATDGPAEEQP